MSARIARRIIMMTSGFVAWAVLAGCYTVLRHPDIGKAYEYEDEYTYVREHCGECHAIFVSPYLPPRPPASHMRRDYESETNNLRNIDTRNPIRRPLGISGSSTESVNAQSAEKKIENERKDSESESAKKKQVPAEKKPVKRDSSEKTKDSEQDTITEKKRQET